MRLDARYWISWLFDETRASRARLQPTSSAIAQLAQTGILSLRSGTSSRMMDASATTVNFSPLLKEVVVARVACVSDSTVIAIIAVNMAIRLLIVGGKMLRWSGNGEAVKEEEM